MSTIQNGARPETEARQFTQVTDETRRRILGLLREAAGPVSERELPERLVAADSDGSDDVTSLRTRLYHVHLPKLADAGLVEWDSDEQVAAAADRLAPDAARPEGRAPADDQGTPAPELGEEYREVLSVVRSATGTVTRADLAHDLASPAADEPSAEDIEVQLHHCYLPKLEDAGLVEYDTETGTVDYSG